MALTKVKGAVGVEEAPADDVAYCRKNGRWEEFMPVLPLPVGSVIAWPGKSAPAGWLTIEPTTVYQKSDYPALYDHLKKECPHLIIDVNTFKLAEARGAFIRGYDPTGVNDPDGVGRELLTPQTDAIRNITGNVALNGRSAVGQPTGAFKNGITKTVVGSTTFSGTSMDFDASRVVPTAAENRPKNLNALWIIKAFDTIADPELLQAKAVIDQVNSNSSRISVLENLSIDYQVMDFGILSKNSQIRKDSPYGNKPIIVEAEIQLNNQWGSGTWFTTTGNASWGSIAKVHHLSGKLGIVLTGGSRAVTASSGLAGGIPQTGSFSELASAPCRVKVWQVGV